MEKSIIDILVNLLTSDATSSIIILFLAICIFLVWKYVISPIRSDIKKVGNDISGFFNNNDIQKNKEVQKDMAKDLDYVVDFIKNNYGLIDVLKEIDKNSSNIILTKENLNEINQDLIYIRRYIDKNFDNHKNLSEISEEIKKVVRYIENNRNNIDGKYMETALRVILEGLGTQTRTRFENNNL